MANTESMDDDTPKAATREPVRSGPTPEDIEAAGLPGRPHSLPVRRATSCFKTKLANSAQNLATSSRSRGHVRGLAGRIKSSIRRRPPKDQVTAIRIRLLERQRKLLQKERVNLLAALRRNEKRRTTNIQMVGKLKEASVSPSAAAAARPDATSGESSWKTMRISY